MTYETVGYVKTLTISSASDAEIALGFSPVSPYSFETEGEMFCLFKGKSQSSNVEIDAIMRRFKKDGVVAMSVADVRMRDALIAAKVNHSKIRVEIDGSCFNRTPEDFTPAGTSQRGSTEHTSKNERNGAELAITAVEFI